MSYSCAFADSFVVSEKDSAQPRIADLMRGKINLFGLDALVNMAIAAGLHVDMRIRQAA